MRAVTPAPHVPPPASYSLPVPPPARLPNRGLPPRLTGRPSLPWRWLIAGGGLLIGLLLIGGLLVLGAAVGNNVLPGVSVAGLSVGGQSVEQATRLLSSQASAVVLRDGDQTYEVAAAELGLQLDSRASAQRAYATGREEGQFWPALFGQFSVPPVVAFDIATAEQYLTANEQVYSLTPVNAGVVLVNGTVQTTPPHAGSQLDIQATLARWQADPTSAFSAGLTLVTQPIAPTVTDATPALNAAQALLANSLQIRVFDAVTGDVTAWSAPPEQWGQWLTAIPDDTSPIGLSLQAQDAPLRDFLQAQAGVFDASRTIDMDAAISAIQRGLAQGNPALATVVVKHLPTQYVIQAGDTLTGIAWNVGMPYPYLQQVNGGRDSFSVGETITIPPADTFLLLPPVPDKRIVVSISRQRVWVYEHGAVIQDWPTSTGIDDSPTWRGLYQIISHEPNAYAGNWNLYMPYFMGVYRPIPGADFTNGFHGFPTRGGGQILWENSLGTRVTYGCILLSNTNAVWLYDWAEDGVVVDIQG